MQAGRWNESGSVMVLLAQFHQRQHLFHLASYKNTKRDKERSENKINLQNFCHRSITFYSCVISKQQCRPRLSFTNDSILGSKACFEFF